MQYTFNWYTHSDPDELDCILKEALTRAGYDTNEIDIDELCQVFGRPFYETTWNITLDTETYEVVVNKVNDIDVMQFVGHVGPFVLRQGFNQAGAT